MTNDAGNGTLAALSARTARASSISLAADTSCVIGVTVTATTPGSKVSAVTATWIRPDRSTSLRFAISASYRCAVTASNSAGSATKVSAPHSVVRS